VVDQGLPKRVVPEVLVVIQILVPRGNPVDALSQECPLGMEDQIRVTRVGDHTIKRGDQIEVPVGLAEQEEACIRGEITPRKIGMDLPTGGAGKWQTIRGTLGHRGGSRDGGGRFVLTHSTTKPWAAAILLSRPPHEKSGLAL
jgi:hypothetical protein